jgi:WD40 repeat protein
MLFSWKDFLNSLEGQTLECTPLAEYRPHFSVHDIEINAFNMDQNLHLFGASGDGFCYKWDTETEQVMQAYPSSKRGYLHTIKILPNSTHLLTGGEDGTIGMWDTKQDKLIATMDVKQELHGEVEPNQLLWVSHIDAANHSKHWWSVCGGASPQTGTKGGFMTTWHAPTRSLASHCVTRESPQQMKFYEDQIVSVADEGVVTYWQPSSCERQQRVWCSPPSAYAVSVRDDGLTAVAGVGGTVDILRKKTKAYSLAVS